MPAKNIYTARGRDGSVVARLWRTDAYRAAVIEIDAYGDHHLVEWCETESDARVGREYHSIRTRSQGDGRRYYAVRLEVRPRG